MIPYGCISTGNEIGMIEVVLNAETVSNIQQAYGGSTAAFRDTPLQEWIRAQNPADEDYEKAVDTFVLSCAGYCVATYILGIGDRHNDNIMVTKSGHLFRKLISFSSDLILVRFAADFFSLSQISTLATSWGISSGSLVSKESAPHSC